MYITFENFCIYYNNSLSILDLPRKKYVYNKWTANCSLVESMEDCERKFGLHKKEKKMAVLVIQYKINNHGIDGMDAPFENIKKYANNNDKTISILFKKDTNVNESLDIFRQNGQETFIIPKDKLIYHKIEQE